MEMTGQWPIQCSGSSGDTYLKAEKTLEDLEAEKTLEDLKAVKTLENLEQW